MTTSCGRYSEKQISRFIDEALSRKELEELREHLDSCSACRDLAEQFLEVTRTFDVLTEPLCTGIDPKRLYRTMQQPPANQAGSRAGMSFRSLFRPFPLFRPLLAAASALLLLIGGIALMNDGISSDNPSAIVTSIDTEYTAVMILETPDTHHTIIWYSET